MLLQEACLSLKWACLASYPAKCKKRENIVSSKFLSSHSKALVNYFIILITSRKSICYILQWCVQSTDELGERQRTLSSQPRNFLPCILPHSGLNHSLKDLPFIKNSFSSKLCTYTLCMQNPKLSPELLSFYSRFFKMVLLKLSLNACFLELIVTHVYNWLP